MQSKSLMRQPPSESERLVIHDQFLRTVDWKSMSFKSRIKPENSVWMEDAKLKNMIICQPEVCIRFIMCSFFSETMIHCCSLCRTVIDSTRFSEVSWCVSPWNWRGPIATSTRQSDLLLNQFIYCDYIFNDLWFNDKFNRKGLPILSHVDDIVFRKPVEIGSLLYFSSQVRKEHST